MTEIGSVRTVFALVAVGVLISGPSHAACTKPAVPACAIQKDAFSGVAEFDQCREYMIAYKGGMETYSSCAKETGQLPEEQLAHKELETTLWQFNRRARGE
jgi:hypothetical protein